MSVATAVFPPGCKRIPVAAASGAGGHPQAAGRSVRPLRGSGSRWRPTFQDPTSFGSLGVVAHRNIGICFDTGNPTALGHETAEDVRLFGPLSGTSTSRTRTFVSTSLLPPGSTPDYCDPRRFAFGRLCGSVDVGDPRSYPDPGRLDFAITCSRFGRAERRTDWSHARFWNPRCASAVFNPWRNRSALVAEGGGDVIVVFTDGGARSPPGYVALVPARERHDTAWLKKNVR